MTENEGKYGKTIIYDGRTIADCEALAKELISEIKNKTEIERKNYLNRMMYTNPILAGFISTMLYLPKKSPVISC